MLACAFKVPEETIDFQQLSY